MESVLQQPLVALPPSKQYNAQSLHLLPCGIDHDGKANIPGFFFLVDGEYQPTSTATAPVAPSDTTTNALSQSSSSPSTTTTTTTTATTATLSSHPEVSFRGRTLKGTTVTVPSGYTGSLYSESTESNTASATCEPKYFKHYDDDKDDNAMDISFSGDNDQDYEAILKSMQEQRKIMRTEAQFSDFTLWGHDEAPTIRSDKVMKAMQWIQIANVLHQPL